MNAASCQASHPSSLSFIRQCKCKGRRIPTALNWPEDVKPGGGYYDHPTLGSIGPDGKLGPSPANTRFTLPSSVRKHWTKSLTRTLCRPHFTVHSFQVSAPTVTHAPFRIVLFHRLLSRQDPNNRHYNHGRLAAGGGRSHFIVHTNNALSLKQYYAERTTKCDLRSRGERFRPGVYSTDHVIFCAQNENLLARS